MHITKIGDLPIINHKGERIVLTDTLIHKDFLYTLISEQVFDKKGCFLEKFHQEAKIWKPSRWIQAPSRL